MAPKRQPPAKTKRAKTKADPAPAAPAAPAKAKTKRATTPKAKAATIRRRQPAEPAQPGFMERFLDNLGAAAGQYMRAQGQHLAPGEPSYESFLHFCSRCLAKGKFDTEEFTSSGLDAWTLKTAYEQLSQFDFGRKILQNLGIPPQHALLGPPGGEGFHPGLQGPPHGFIGQGPNPGGHEAEFQSVADRAYAQAAASQEQPASSWLQGVLW